MKILLISDTHGYLDERIFHHAETCDEIWHAGDIGEGDVLEQIQEFKPTMAVYGNIDSLDYQHSLPEVLEFEREGVKVFMIHIGGKPPRFAKGVKALLKQAQPDLFICGHSHVLKVMRDDQLDLLYMNPGAAGQQGFHRMRTLLRFDLKDGGIKNLEVIELGRRGRA